jgi:acyl carrier protein
LICFYKPFYASEHNSMTPAEIRDAVLDILNTINPDEDLSSLDDEQEFRDQLEMDSMDFLDIVMELRKRYRVQVPEEDYGNLVSMTKTVAYLEPKMKDISA